MSEIDNWDDLDEELADNNKSKKNNDPDQYKGNLNWVMTVAAFLAAAAGAALMAFATAGISTRPWWLLGCCFAVPVAAMLTAVMVVELITSKMTGSYTRKKQALLCLACSLVAFFTGSLCALSSTVPTTEEIISEETITEDGWSNILIVLDKSGSMGSTLNDGRTTRNNAATTAVINLINKMDDSVSVGLLIDVGWTQNNDSIDQVALSKRQVAIKPLTDSQRTALKNTANIRTYNNEYFKVAITTALDMIAGSTSSSEPITILFISDGDDCMEDLRASAFVDQLKQKNITFVYLYVNDTPDGELKKLAEATGGECIYAKDGESLLNSMARTVKKTETKVVTSVEVIQNDSLRNINESTRSMIITGVLLMILGGLIGCGLTILFSYTGQKRAQLWISPLMCLLAFLVLTVGHNLIPSDAIRECIAFALIGVVIMKTNRDGEVDTTHGLEELKQHHRKVVASSQNTAIPNLDDDWF